MLKRPQLSYEALAEIDPERPDLPQDVQEQVNIRIKYAGYIDQQLKQVEQFKKLEGRLLPMELDYETIQGLRLEARQKLNLVRPENLGQASRITGVSPADISVLLIYMEQMKRKHKNMRKEGDGMKGFFLPWNEREKPGETGREKALSAEGNAFPDGCRL